MSFLNNFYTHLANADKKLSKQRLKESLIKRFKEYLGERIFKLLVPVFNNFTMNLEFDMFRDCVENFINQKQHVTQLKFFMFVGETEVLF